MCIWIHSGDLQGGVDVRLNMCDNILLYSNPFKDFFIKRHKSNLHLLNRNDFFLTYLQTSDYVYLNTLRNQWQFMYRRWNCKHEECGMSSLDQQIPHHISNQIVFLYTPDSKDIYKKKIILQIWTSSLFLCRARALNFHVHMSCSLYGKYLQPEEVCWVLFTI